MSRFLAIWDKKNDEIKNSLIASLDEIASDIGVEMHYYPLEDKNISKQFGEIRKVKADYLLVFDMAGFQQTTLQEVASYNIMPAKQIHFLFNNDKKYRTYLCQALALNLFLLEDNEELYRRYKRDYSQILNLDLIEKLTITKHPSVEQMDANKKIMLKSILSIYNEVESSTLLIEAQRQKTLS